MSEHQGAPRGADRSRFRAGWAMPLIPVALSGFLLSAMTWLRLQPAGHAAGRTGIQGVVAGLYESFGFESLFMVCVLVMTWSSIWFLTGRVDRPLSRLARIGALGLCLAILVNLRVDGTLPNGGGDLGAMLAARMSSVFTPSLSILLVASAAVAALLLATDFFFFGYFEQIGSRSRSAATAVGASEVSRLEELRLEVPEVTAASPTSEAGRRGGDGLAAEVGPDARDRTLDRATPAGGDPESDGSGADRSALDGVVPAVSRTGLEERSADGLTEQGLADDAFAGSAGHSSALETPDDREVDAAWAAEADRDDLDESEVSQLEREALEQEARSGSDRGDESPDAEPFEDTDDADLTAEDLDDPDEAVSDDEESGDPARYASVSDAAESTRARFDDAEFDDAESDEPAELEDTGDGDAEPDPADFDDTDLDDVRAPRSDAPSLDVDREDVGSPDEAEDLRELPVAPASPVVIESLADSADPSVHEPIVEIAPAPPVRRDDEAARQRTMFAASDSELIEEAEALVLEYRRASANFLRRRLRVSMDEAVELLQQLARRGVIDCEAGAAQGRIVSGR